jgi:molybdopterin synthase sulfur carrier subunit
MFKLLYFFNLVDTLGRAQEEIELPEGVNDVAALLKQMRQNDEKYRAGLADGSKFQVTINKKFVDTAATIKDGNEIAFFPNTK